MDENLIQQIRSQIRLNVTADNQPVPAHNYSNAITIDQLDDYRIKNYRIEITSLDDIYILVRYKQANKWINCKKSEINFEIDKPIQEIEISFAIPEIPPVKYEIKVQYSNKEAFDKLLAERKIIELKNQLGCIVGRNTDFAWIITRKPKWLSYYEVHLKFNGVDFINATSNGDEHLLLDKLPGGSYQGKVDAYDKNNKLIVSQDIEFNIKTMPTDPEQRHCVTFQR